MKGRLSAILHPLANPCQNFFDRIPYFVEFHNLLSAVYQRDVDVNAMPVGYVSQRCAAGAESLARASFEQIALYGPFLVSFGDRHQNRYTRTLPLNRREQVSERVGKTAAPLIEHLCDDLPP